MWSLNYDNQSYKFNHVAVTSAQLDGRSYRVDDATLPRADGVAFGQDFADPGDVKLDLLLNFATVRNLDMQRAMLTEAAEAFLIAWDAAPLRSIPGAVGELIVPKIGMFEGRPRRAEWDWSTFGLGYLIGTATFIRSTLETYRLDADGNAPWHSASLNLVPAQMGGIRSPLRSPLRTATESSRSAPITVGGTSPAWPVIELRGPIQSGAQIEVVNRWRLYLNRGLAEGQTARIDTRPGRTATYINNRAVQVLDPRSSMLANCSLLPGSNIAALRGVSIEGTAHVRFDWRDTRGAI